MTKDSTVIKKIVFLTRDLQINTVSVLRRSNSFLGNLRKFKVSEILLGKMRDGLTILEISMKCFQSFLEHFQHPGDVQLSVVYEGETQYRKLDQNLFGMKLPRKIHIDSQIILRIWKLSALTNRIRLQRKCRALFLQLTL